MQGYEVVTSDGRSAGRVVGISGDLLVIEHGTLLKRRHALPRELVQVDDEAETVHATVTKELLEDGPKVDGDVDSRAVATYYGLGRG